MIMLFSENSSRLWENWKNHDSFLLNSSIRQNLVHSEPIKAVLAAKYWILSYFSNVTSTTCKKLLLEYKKFDQKYCIQTGWKVNFSNFWPLSRQSKNLNFLQKLSKKLIFSHLHPLTSYVCLVLRPLILQCLVVTKRSPSVVLVSLLLTLNIFHTLF